MQRLSLQARTALHMIFITAQRYADEKGEPVSMFEILEALDYLEWQSNENRIAGLDDGTFDDLEKLNEEMSLF